MKNETDARSIHNWCERLVSLAARFLRGTMLVGIVWRRLGILMLLYNLSSIVLFWALTSYSERSSS
jgi:hypothetical protein